MAPINIACHCGAVSQPLTVDDQAVKSIKLCQCRACRHTTGLLCTSYCPIRSESGELELDKTTGYEVGDGEVLYFCAVCGCHVFRERRDEGTWEVATGVIAEGGGPGDTGQAKGEHSLPRRLFGGHNGVEDSLDGGLTIWLNEPDTNPDPNASKTPNPEPDQKPKQPTLQAHCHCTRTTFHLTRPDNSSPLPRSNFPDLMIPYLSASPQIANPADTKWWLRPGGKYLAGTCACRSCRLTSGFEIQTWAFVPRTNIFFGVRGQKGGGDGGGAEPGEGREEEGVEREEVVPLDFEELHGRGVLRGYESSKGVMREFCPTCGATVFWHDKWRPELIDVSVGLLDDPSGSRAEPWLDWWTDRVSFAEDAGSGRKGAFAERAVRLVARLEEGLSGN